METTKIQWTDATWNPFYGCRKVSAECKYCYMYRDQERYGRNPSIVFKSKTTFDKPLSWKAPKVIFTCSWSDWFIEEGDEWRNELWKIIKATPHHTYQILTKRPERILQCLPDDWGQGYENVWLGVSVGTNDGLQRCKILGKIPAKVKFISAEPLLEDLIGLNEILVENKIDWCIIGGESGNNVGKYRFRECKMQWITNIIGTCEINNVKVFVKQLGTFLGQAMMLKDTHGGDMTEWPVEFQIREFPSTEKSIVEENNFTANEQTDSLEGIIANLSPLKKVIAVALQSGENPQALAERLSTERGMPLRTYKAYVTMVVNLFKDASGQQKEINPTDKKGDSKKLSPFKQIIADALYAGERPLRLASRLAAERNIPGPTAQAYVTMVLNALQIKY